MPRIKRWLHLSQDLNRDPQFREFAKKFGLGGVRFWLEVLAILDRNDNYWDLQKGFDLGLLAGSCETKKRIIQESFEHLKDINWLRVGVDPEQKVFIYAPKWAEYNKRREDRGNMMDTTRYQQSTHPTPSPSPFLKKEINKEKSFDNSSQVRKEDMGREQKNIRTVRPRYIYCNYHYDDSVKCMERVWPRTESERATLVESGWLCDHHKEVQAGEGNEECLSTF